MLDEYISQEELTFEFDERRAIMEIDGGLSREDAEWEALQLMMKKYGNISDNVTGAIKNEQI